MFIARDGECSSTSELIAELLFLCWTMM